MSGPTWKDVEKLQAALNFWMPTMGQADEKWHDRIADDACLLMGFTGKGVDEPSYHDLLAAEPVPYTITPAGREHLDGKA